MNEQRVAAFGRLEERARILGSNLPSDEAAQYASERDWCNRGHRAEGARIDAALREFYGR